MKVDSKKLDKNEMELIIEVSAEKMQPFLEKAAQQISQEVKISGFRPGKAPYDIIKQQVGEMAIYEKALEPIVRSTFVEAVQNQKLETVSQPKIEIVKLAPANPVIYKATVALMPKVTLGDYKDIKVKQKKAKVEEKDVEKALQEITQMQTKETVADHPVGEKDKAVVDMEMFLDKVPVEGGQSKDFAVYMDGDKFIPGFTEKLIGQKKGEIRTFNLTFPKDYFQKNLAGKEVEFKVTIKEVYDLHAPEINDELAKSLGQKSLEELKKIIRENMEKEAQFKEEQKAEQEMLEKLVEVCKYEEIPQILLESEAEKMIMELKDNLVRQGMQFEDYMKDVLKKKPEELRKEFLPEAEKRVKTALAMRALSLEKDIKAGDKEIEDEMNKMLEQYKGQEQIQEQIKSLSGRDYISNLIRNRKIIEFLKKEIIVSE